MAQTALQRAIYEIQSKIAHLESERLLKDGLMARAFIGIEIDNLKEYVQQLTDLLPYERETIESAYQLGNDDANRENIGDVGDRQYINKKDYFITTYNQ